VENFFYRKLPINVSELIISQESAKQRILSAIADEYSRKILTFSMDGPVSALHLSKIHEIPITTVYRRIEELVEAGLLAAVKSGRTADGKWYDLYKSLISFIDVSFDNGNMRVEVEIDKHVSDKFTKILSSLI